MDYCVPMVGVGRANSWAMAEHDCAPSLNSNGKLDLLKLTLCLSVSIYALASHLPHFVLIP